MRGRGGQWSSSLDWRKADVLLPFGLFAWLSACLSAGPAQVAQPLLLRLFLWLSNTLPWDLRSLLDQAAERGLLRKAWGSYRLSYRLLLSYFDSLDQPLPPYIAALLDSFTVSSFPPTLTGGQPLIIIYDGWLSPSAHRLTIHWGYNSWEGITDTAMTKHLDGTWQAIITLPLDQGVAVFRSALTQEKCNNHAASKKAFAGVSALVHFSLTPLIELVCMHRSIQDTLICFLF